MSGDRARLFHADVEYLRWRAACLETADTLLDSGLLTEAGTLLVTETVRELISWSARPILPDTKTAACRIADEHRARWRSRNGEPTRWGRATWIPSSTA
ncbi:MAG TPA: hypothetical protein VFX16_08240 [Pseudonocardiaceae bacterium]|nr:hypothetical protein [Pseudonocardiaceae bacterium]